MTARPAIPAAGGGGASTVFAQPAWQTGLGVPNNGARNVPDIALAASPNHDGYLVYSGGQHAVYGGTSAPTPSFAGIAALLNHYLVSTGAQTVAGVGNMNPRLYALAQAGTGAFHDITTGDNIVTVTCGARTRNCVAGSYGYAAGQGYDQASGLGSVDAYNLVTSWNAGSSSRASASLALQASATSVAVHGLRHHHRNRDQHQRRHAHRRRSPSPRAASRSASHRSAAPAHPPPPASRSPPRNCRSGPTASWPSTPAIPL